MERAWRVGGEFDYSCQDLLGLANCVVYRWLFIFDGIISFPIAIWGFYALPDQPRDTRAKWLKPSVSPVFSLDGLTS